MNAQTCFPICKIISKFRFKFCQIDGTRELCPLAPSLPGVLSCKSNGAFQRVVVVKGWNLSVLRGGMPFSSLAGYALEAHSLWEWVGQV